MQGNAQSWRRNSSYGSPPWKTGAALPFLSLRRDFLQDCWRSKAAQKLKSSTMRCCWEAGGGLATSKHLFTGLRLSVLFFNFPEESRGLLGPGNRKGDTYRNVLNLPLFHNTWAPDTGSGCWIFRWWPNATHCIPLLLRVFNNPPPIQGLTHAPTHVSHHLRARHSLHVAPGLENSAMCDPVRNSCRLSQHSDAGVRKEVPLREMRTPYKILYIKDGTVYFICADHHAIRIDQKSRAKSHWYAHNKSC